MAPELEIRRKKLKFRAWHRGLRELDLILGPFADSCLDRLDVEGLDEFELLLNVPDQDLLDWILGRDFPPDGLRTKLYAKLQDYCRSSRRV